MIRWIIFLLPLIAAACPAFAADKEGSTDYPGIGRFEGSIITKFDVANFDQTVLATGPILKTSDAENALTVKGKITRIVYKVPDGTSALEVFRNFQNRINEVGYTTIFSGGPDQVDDYRFKYKHSVEKLEEISLSSNIWYLSAKKPGGESDIYLSLVVSPHSGGDGQRVRLIIAETKAMENRMVDAEKMQASIAESGKVALYGIYFDTDSSTIKESSKPTMDEIGKLLRNNAGMRIIVVGHTDNQGGYDYNMDLSKRRAMAVTENLRKDYKIEDSRLKSAGVGYLAPAASNATEDGRALNRRVELVKDK